MSCIPSRDRAPRRGWGRTWLQQQGLALSHPVLVQEGEFPQAAERAAVTQPHGLRALVLHLDGDCPGLAECHIEADLPVGPVMF